MYFLKVVQNQWLMIAVLGGAVGAIIIVLTYIMMWRPRTGQEASDAVQREPWAFTARHVPWLIYFFFATVTVCGVVYAVSKIINPPSGW